MDRNEEVVLRGILIDKDVKNNKENGTVSYILVYSYITKSLFRIKCDKEIYDKIKVDSVVVLTAKKYIINENTYYSFVTLI